MLRWAAVTWASFNMLALWQRSHSILRNHDGNAVNGSASASWGVGSGSSV